MPDELVTLPEVVVLVTPPVEVDTPPVEVETPPVEVDTPPVEVETPPVVVEVNVTLPLSVGTSTFQNAWRMASGSALPAFSIAALMT